MNRLFVLPMAVLFLMIPQHLFAGQKAAAILNLYDPIGHPVLAGEMLRQNRRDDRSILKIQRSGNGKQKERLILEKIRFLVHVWRKNKELYTK